MSSDVDDETYILTTTDVGYAMRKQLAICLTFFEKLFVPSAAGHCIGPADFLVCQSHDAAKYRQSDRTGIR
jgi:hypothetical protein